MSHTLTGKPCEKHLLGWPRRRWGYNIKVDVTYVVCEHQKWKGAGSGSGPMAVLSFPFLLS